MPHSKLARPVVAVVVLAGAAALGLGGLTLAETVPADSTTPTTTASSGSPGASTDNVAVAANTKDGRTVVALSIKIVQTDSSSVDAANAAVAAASCTDCQTVAIALEGVLIIGSPTDFQPTNIALAINSECTNCQTLAAAYQSVVQNDTRVRITGSGRQQIAAIRTDLLSLRNSGLDIATIQQRVNDAAGRFVAVLQNEVVPVGTPAVAGQPSSASSATSTTPTTVATTSTTTTAPATTTPSTTTPPTTAPTTTP
ncbi:MAG: hypothetical protein ACRD12_08350 [Acidimicrobiales bacterium]